MGKPTLYTPELGLLICDKIATSSNGLVKICSARNLPHHSTVLSWLGQADKKDFLLSYIRAREAQADLLSDEIIEIADTIDEEKDAPTTVSRARLRIDARKWKAAKLAPNKYGDKATDNTKPDNDEEPVGNVIVWGAWNIPV